MGRPESGLTDKVSPLRFGTGMGRPESGLTDKVSPLRFGLLPFSFFVDILWDIRRIELRKAG
jgi:hypothetical protein